MPGFVNKDFISHKLKHSGSKKLIIHSSVLSLSEISQVLQKSNSSSSFAEGNPDGVLVGKIGAYDVLFPWACVLGGVNKDANGEAIDGPEDADFFPAVGSTR